MRATLRLVIVSMVAVVACGGTPARHGAAGGSRVLVREFEMTGTKIENYDAATSGYGLEFAQALAKNLREKGFQADAVPHGAAVPKGVMTVQGKVLRIDGGSRALRYTVSFGAGAAEFGVQGNVVGSVNEAVGQFATSRRAGVGAFGGDTETLMHRCVESTADDVADMVATGRYKIDD
jgi:hypothetical protein